MEDVIFKYKFGDDIEFELKEKDFVTIVGNNNDLIVHTLLHGNKKAEIIVNNSKFEYKTLLTLNIIYTNSPRLNDINGFKLVKAYIISWLHISNKLAISGNAIYLWPVFTWSKYS